MAYEFKSYASGTVSSIGSSFLPQHLSYLSDGAIMDISQIRYIFNEGKLKPPFNIPGENGVSKEVFVRYHFYKLWKDYSEEVYTNSPELFNGLSKSLNGVDVTVNDEDTFEAYLELIDGTESIFNFIKVE